MKRGFTIVELMVSVGIIAILLTIVIVAAGGAQKGARDKRTEALRVALEQAVTAYYAQVGEWPNAIETKIDSIRDESYTFTENETDSIFREVVGKAFGRGKGARAVLVDVSALFVAKTSNLGPKPSTGCAHCGLGMDFAQMQAKGAGASSMVNQLSFGYPCADHGRFCRFKISYDVKSDSVTVSK